jgi:hypothetical protein
MYIKDIHVMIISQSGRYVNHQFAGNVSRNHPNQSDCVNSDQKKVISKHTKGAPTKSTPSIDRTSKNPYWIENM